MKSNLKQIIKRTPKRIYFYSTLAVVLALITFLILNYYQFYVHEFGHASAAVLYSMTTHNESITINFTYINYKIPLTNIGLLAPQQTITRYPGIMSVYGVLFEIIFYASIFTLIAYILSKIRRMKDNNRIAFALMGVLVLLIINDIVSNLFCGTDGLKFSCSNSFLMIFSGIFMFLLLSFLGYFYMELLIFRSNIFNKINKQEVK